MPPSSDDINRKASPGISERRVTGWLEPLDTGPVKRKAELHVQSLQVENYLVVPPGQIAGEDSGAVWRVVFEPMGVNVPPLALEIHGDVILGSDAAPDSDLDVNLITYDGWMRGVSRRHVMLRPSKTKLFIMDLRSTNGTQINGLPLGVGWAYALKQGDIVSLAKLNFTVSITGKPG